MPGKIAVYGATGRLGRLVVDELVSRGISVRLGGRDPGKLRAVATRLDTTREWTAAPIDDGPRLRELLEGCRVVVNAAPASRTGERLIQAALEARVHYLDGAGEQSLIRRVFEHHGTAAERQGVALVPAAGFDYALGDCLAHLVAREHQPTREVVVAYAIDGAEVGANSLRSAADTPGGEEVSFEGGAWRRARQGIYRRAVEFPAPFGRQMVARYGSGEIVTVPHHISTDMVTSLITTRSLVPHPVLVPVFPYLRPVVGFIRRTPARRALALAARLGRRPAKRSGAATRSPRFAIVAWTLTQDDRLSQGVIEGGDFHRVTAATLAFGARSLAMPSFEKRGTLPPATAFEPEALLDELRPLGVTWRVEHSDTRRPRP